MALSFSTFHCDVCNVTVNSQSQLSQHYVGSKHKMNASGNPPVPLTAKQRIDKIKSAGLGNNFVKAGSSYQNLSNNASVDSSNYCSICRINMTSPVQAQAHFAGSKHQQRLQLLQEERNSQNANGGADPQMSGFNNPDTYCSTCRIKLTSPSQAQVHYSGAKHKQKLKLSEDEGKSMALGGPATQIALQEQQRATPSCETCRTTFTSQSQAETHFNGAKHKHRLRLLDEAKNFQSQPSVEGEPSAKKAKFLSLCETCNVSMTCPDMVTAHYNGSKHKKKVALWTQMGMDNGANVMAQTDSNCGGRRPIQKGDGVQRGGHFFCSFCNVTVNSQAQMDAHRTGSKHKSKVSQIASQSNTSTMIQQNVVQSMNVTTSYTMSSANQGSFPIHNSINPGGYPQDPTNPASSFPPNGAYPFMYTSGVMS